MKSSIQTKNGYLYGVIIYKDEADKIKPKWILEDNKRFCGTSYDRRYLDYVCVHV